MKPAKRKLLRGPGFDRALPCSLRIWLHFSQRSSEMIAGQEIVIQSDVGLYAQFLFLPSLLVWLAIRTPFAVESLSNRSTVVSLNCEPFLVRYPSLFNSSAVVFLRLSFRNNS